MRVKIIIISFCLLIISEFIIYKLHTNKKEDVEEQITIPISTTTSTSKSSTTTTQTTTKKKTTKKITTIKITENEITNYLYKRVKEEGWLTSDYNAICNIIIKESSFNINSVNKKSGACGLFQAYPCSKAIKEYPDYMTNYKSQVDWGIKYIKQRYETPKKAWEFWEEHHWY